MTRRALPLAAALAVAAANAGAKPVPRAASARQDFLAGVESHLKEDNDAAAKDWARCLTKAAKGSDDESDCRLFAGMVQEQLAPNAPVPDPKSEARRAYVEGRDAYLRKDFASADRRWHDCLGASDRDPASRPDCLMAVELTKEYRRRIEEAGAGHAPSAAELKAQQTYLEGVVYYQKSDDVNARKKWTHCAALNADCRAGLDKLDQLSGSAHESAPSDTARSAQQTYLEGVIYYQKGDYLKAQKRWIACGELNADCREGVKRIDAIFGSSTAPDEKK